MEEERKNEVGGNPVEREFIEHIRMEVSAVRDMLIMNRKGMEDEKDVEMVQSVLQNAEKSLKDITEKMERFLT